MSVSIRLMGARRYFYRGTLFERGKIYRVSEARAAHLLKQADPNTGWTQFGEVPKADVARAVAAKKKAPVVKKKVAPPAEIVDVEEGTAEPGVPEEVPGGDSDLEPELDPEVEEVEAGGQPLV